jgi:hypothetical protein
MMQDDARDIANQNFPFAPGPEYLVVGSQAWLLDASSKSRFHDPASYCILSQLCPSNSWQLLTEGPQ